VAPQISHKDGRHERRVVEECDRFDIHIETHTIAIAVSLLQRRD
jgi:hypothetical protein